ATPSTYILAPRSETLPSGTPPWTPLLLPIPLPTSSPPLLLPTADFRADYGFVGTLDANPDREIELGQRMIDFITIVRQDTYEIYGRLDDAHDDRSLMSAHQIEIGDLRAADRRRQAQLAEALTLLRTLQTQMVALQSQQRPARDPTHPDV
ncbi:hypothetical protein Tco_0240193, partial [Tanacetum coccineum]